MINRLHVKSLFVLALSIAAIVISVMHRNSGALYMPWLFLVGMGLLLLSVVFGSTEADALEEAKGRGGEERTASAGAKTSAS